MWSFAEDLDTFEHAVMEFFGLTVGVVSLVAGRLSQGLCAHSPLQGNRRRYIRFCELSDLYSLGHAQTSQS